MMRNILCAAAALAALGWLGAPQAYAFTERPVFNAGPGEGAPMAEPNERLPLFDHRYDPPARSDRDRPGTSFDLPGGGTFQFYGPSSGRERQDDTRFFGRMPDSLPR